MPNRRISSLLGEGEEGWLIKEDGSCVGGAGGFCCLFKGGDELLVSRRTQQSIEGQKHVDTRE